MPTPGENQALKLLFFHDGFDGAGRIEFGGDRANTFAGPLTVVEGQLRLNKDGAAAVPGQLVLGSGAPGGFDASALCLRPNQFAPGATAIVHRAGSLDLDDHAQTLSGLTFNGGRVTGSAGLLTMNGPVVANPAGTNSRLDGLVFLGFVPRTFTVGGETREEGLRIDARLSGAASASLIKNGRVRKIGPGTLTLTAIIANDGSDAVLGTFAGKPEGASFTLGGGQWRISYQGGDGNDVVLTQLTTSTQDFAPTLRLEQFAADQVRLLWSTNEVDFQLESTASMPASAWQSVPGAPGVVANKFFLDVPATTNPATFFRLVRPGTD